MKPYPWNGRKRFEDRRFYANSLKKIGTLFAIIATILSLGTSWIVSFILRQGYDTKNDSWWKRGLMMSGFGAVLMALGMAGVPYLGSPMDFGRSFLDLLYSFGDKATMEPRTALINMLGAGVPIAFVLHGLANIIECYWFEYHGERYLLRSVPTRAMKRRAKANASGLRSAKNSGDGWLRYGILVDDPIPWRTPRYGMICERPIEKLGHGIILGGNGTGKTVCALSMAHQAAASDAAVLYADYKASLETYKSMRAAAQAAGVPFYSFDLGINSGERTWYDPLAWKGSPSEKASMLVTSFNFSETGDSSFYKNVAEQWLTLQFEVMAHVGIYEGESQFDFLLDTASPAGLSERIAAMKSGSDADRDLFSQWKQTMASVEAKHLASLRANLSNVVNAGGERLRPQGDSPAISLKQIAEQGGVCYIGLSPSTNDVALKIIGSLVLRDLGVLASERMRVANKKGLRQFLALVDEASRMGPRAVVMDNLFAMAREGQIHLWPITQSFSTWPASTKTEMTTNASSRIIFRVQDPKTAEEISTSLGKIPAMTEMSEEKVEHRMMRGETSSMEGESRLTLGRDLMVDPDHLGSPNTLPNEHAYIWFSGSRQFPTRRRWRSRRVRKDDIGHDAPLVRIIVADDVVNPPEEALRGRAFDDIVQDQRRSAQSNGNGADPSQVEAGVDTPVGEPERHAQRPASMREHGTHPLVDGEAVERAMVSDETAASREWDGPHPAQEPRRSQDKDTRQSPDERKDGPGTGSGEESLFASGMPVPEDAPPDPYADDEWYADPETAIERQQPDLPPRGQAEPRTSTQDDGDSPGDKKSTKRDRWE